MLQIISPNFFFFLFFLSVVRASGSGLVQGFAALNLAYYLIEYYTEVRRTLVEPKSATYSPLTNPLPAVCTLQKKKKKKKKKG